MAGAAGLPELPKRGLYGDRVDEFWERYALEVAGMLEDDALAAAKERLGAALADGADPETLLTDLDDTLADFLPEVDAAGRTVNVPARIENIARTNVANAIGAGRMQTFQDPDLEGFLAGLQYTAVLDARVRPNHAAWNGIVRTADWWDEKGVPPSGFQCRCLTVPVTIYDEAGLTPDDELPNVQNPEDDIPDENFDPA